MRHASIATTMDFYANVDEAVEEAVLGPQRNGLRNTNAAANPEQDQPFDATSSGYGSGVQPGGFGCPNQ